MNTHLFPQIRLLRGNELKRVYHLGLIYQEENNKPNPVITFVSTKNGEEEHIQDIESYSFSGSDLVRSAFQNLKKINLEWNWVEKNNAIFLQLKDEHFATEKILDTDFLLEASNLLNCKKLAVGIPCRGNILCANYDDSESLSTIKAEIQLLFNDFSKEQISGEIFVVEGGKIISNINIENTATVNDAYIPDGFVYNLTKLHLYESLYCLKLQLEVDDSNVFSQGLYSVLIEVLQKYSADKNFNGQIEVQSVIGKPKKNEKSIQDLFEFVERLGTNPLFNQLRMNMSETLKMSFLFGIDFQNGDVHNVFKFQFINNKK